MTIIEAVNQIDNLKRNTFSQKQKIVWLSRLESMVKRLVIDTHEGSEDVSFNGFTENTDLQTVLMMPEPFDEAYIYWLEAQIHYANEDIDMYNSAIMMFNASFEGYKAYYKQNHRPKGAGRFRF